MKHNKFEIYTWRKNFFNTAFKIIIYYVDQCEVCFFVYYGRFRWILTYHKDADLSVGYLIILKISWTLISQDIPCLSTDFDHSSPSMGFMAVHLWLNPSTEPWIRKWAILPVHVNDTIINVCDSIISPAARLIAIYFLIHSHSVIAICVCYTWLSSVSKKKSSLLC